MPDIIQKLGHSTIHHGPFNNRIFLLKLADGDSPGILPELNAMADKSGYSKIIAKIPFAAADEFIRDGYQSEACIPGYFSNSGRDSDALFMVKYTDSQRAIDTHRERTRAVLEKAAEKSGAGFPSALPPSYVCRPAEKFDTPQMADLYRRIFPTYPFPIDDPGFLAETMAHHCRYMGIWKNEALVSIASADMEIREKNAEMTDFATHPNHRGGQLAGMLLQSLETSITAEHIKTAYTIARARSFGMNITFSRAGYFFAGTLINNTNISGQIESMNVWYKPLLPEP